MDRRKPRIFKESFHLKIVRTLITIGGFSLVLIALLGLIVLFWLPAVKSMGLTGSGKLIFLNLLKVFLMITIVLLGLILWISFLISRNLFGPLTRLRNHVEMLIKGGSLDKIRFRKSDELVFHYLSEIFNQLMDREITLRKDTEMIEKDIADFLEQDKKGIIKKSAYIPFIREIKKRFSSLTKIT